MTVLVDSDILIEVSRGKDLGIISEWNALSESSSVVLFSSVTAAELWAGARPTEHAAIQALFGSLVCVPVDAKTGYVAGTYLRRFAKSHGVELGDAIIAASAVAANAVLWTRNRKHYPMKEVLFFRSIAT